MKYRAKTLAGATPMTDREARTCAIAAATCIAVAILAATFAFRRRPDPAELPIEPMRQPIQTVFEVHCQHCGKLAGTFAYTETEVGATK